MTAPTAPPRGRTLERPNWLPRRCSCAVSALPLRSYRTAPALPPRSHHAVSAIPLRHPCAASVPPWCTPSAPPYWAATTCHVKSMKPKPNSQWMPTGAAACVRRLHTAVCTSSVYHPVTVLHHPATVILSLARVINGYQPSADRLLCVSAYGCAPILLRIKSSSVRAPKSSQDQITQSECPKIGKVKNPAF